MKRIIGVLLLTLSVGLAFSCVSIAISTDSGGAVSKAPDTDRKTTIGVSNDEEGREDRGSSRNSDEVDHQDGEEADHNS